MLPSPESEGSPEDSNLGFRDWDWKRPVGASWRLGCSWFAPGRLSLEPCLPPVSAASQRGPDPRGTVSELWLMGGDWATRAGCRVTLCRGSAFLVKGEFGPSCSLREQGGLARGSALILSFPASRATRNTLLLSRAFCSSSMGWLRLSHFLSESHCVTNLVVHSWAPAILLRWPPTCLGHRHVPPHPARTGRLTNI